MSQLSPTPSLPLHFFILHSFPIVSYSKRHHTKGILGNSLKQSDV